MKLENFELNRLTVHKIYGKTKANAQPYADACNDFCKLGIDGDETLSRRILSSLQHRSKFFELDLHDQGKESFFELHKPLWGSSKDSFISTSRKIAEKAALAHDKGNIPDGLIMVIEAKIDAYNTVIVVKAEKSNAFSMTGNSLQLIKDIFLSSDKTLYKIGFFVRTDKSNTSRKAYRYFVYDDGFAPSKDDLAVYFYSKFLGLTTDQNSKLQTKRLYSSLVNFAGDNIEIRDRMEVLRNIDRAFMDEDRKNLVATEFKLFFPNELSQQYDSGPSVEFPLAIVKDNSLVGGLKTKRISISPNATILLKTNPEGLLIGNTGNEKEKNRLKTVIDSGNNYNYVVIPSGFPSQPFIENGL